MKHDFLTKVQKSILIFLCVIIYSIYFIIINFLIAIKVKLSLIDISLLYICDLNKDPVYVLSLCISLISEPNIQRSLCTLIDNYLHNSLKNIFITKIFCHILSNIS